MSPLLPEFDVIVLGAGAAGMMCAFEAGRRGRRVLLLDHGERVGRKILISGGGRCNFTNVHTRAENFLSANPHFAKSALARFTPSDMIALVEKHGIRYHEKTLGQLFCDDSAQRIVTLLERECGEAGVEIRCGVKVNTVRRESTLAHATKFIVETSVGDFTCESVVVATGGLSIPKMGATGFGYELAQQFGHSLVEPRAALVPLVFAPEDRERWCDLSGVSFEVMARAGASGKAKSRPQTTPEFREKLLITHRGVSGPAVLQVSSYWKPGEQVRFDLAPSREVLASLLEKNARREPASLVSALRTVLPARMAERWVAAQPSHDWTNTGIARMEAELHAWTLTPAGTEGFAKAEVTVGGIDTSELDARTMESRRMPGLYFIGEVVDVTGWLGGYNFQWAWASAVSAGSVA
ncbi:BaiN/RdsA family NAD(P)/FAD-dependent oxidoreductase [Granulicella mallensis]|uniref:HI0933 family protein n=1 Tax=Granulicella mallensis (strain ATCC BAA-1857 / DSM 23137 / MP5ACTX8) TaxID=682795 RepID=G8NXK5_GRAMM|nr:NAD(P)/FAD-dependent oxidoreductase [Granulicella mallensis]AEU39000.1 HI0933 family protein [Granulicella mallensis MP5ACTX8]